MTHASGAYQPLDQIILLGDSLLQWSFKAQQGFNFGAALTNDYVRKLDVINRGFSGYNTVQALKTIERTIPPPEAVKVRLLVVFLGANDARLPNTPCGPQQHIPVEQYAENLNAIVTHPRVQAQQAKNGTRLVIITPPPIEERMRMQADREDGVAVDDSNPTRSISSVRMYAEAACAVASAHNIPIFDMFRSTLQRAIRSEDDWEKTLGTEVILPGDRRAPLSKDLQDCFTDGLHLSSLGYEILYTGLTRTIAAHYPDQVPDHLPNILPNWDDNLWDTEDFRKS